MHIYCKYKSIIVRRMSLISKIGKGLRNTALISAAGIGIAIPTYYGVDYTHDKFFNQIPSLHTFQYDSNQVFDMLTQVRPNLHGNERGVSISRENPASYRELARRVSQQYENRGRNPFTNYNLEDVLLGLMTIESRGVRNAIAPRTGASGIMQLMPETAQQDCGIEPSRTNHRFLQMDCAADLLTRSYRFLQPTVESRFGGFLSENQLQELTEHFAITAYNNGMGNVRNAIMRYDISTLERFNISSNPFFDLEEIVPRVIGAGNVGALKRESLEYFPRFLQVYNDVINPPLLSSNRFRWKRNEVSNFFRYFGEDR